MDADQRKTRNIEFRKDFFKVGEQCSFQKNHGKYEKRQRYHACNKRIKNESFGMKTKVSHDKNFFRTFVSNRNGNDPNTNE